MTNKRSWAHYTIDVMSTRTRTAATSRRIAKAIRTNLKIPDSNVKVVEGGQFAGRGSQNRNSFKVSIVKVRHNENAPDRMFMAYPSNSQIQEAVMYGVDEDAYFTVRDYDLRIDG